MRTVLLFLVVVLGLAGCDSSTPTATQPTASEPTTPTQQYTADDCVADAEKLCADVQAGEGRVAKCLQSQPDKLSPACKAFYGL